MRAKTSCGVGASKINDSGKTIYIEERGFRSTFRKAVAELAAPIHFFLVMEFLFQIRRPFRACAPQRLKPRGVIALTAGWAPRWVVSARRACGAHPTIEPDALALLSARAAQLGACSARRRRRRTAARRQRHARARRHSSGRPDARGARWRRRGGGVWTRERSSDRDAARLRSLAECAPARAARAARIARATLARG